jgi:hypothetical protein
MPKYEVYATRFDDPHIIEEMLPARGLEFTMPLSDTGECRFSATVEPGRSFWRAAIAAFVSGVLVCRDGVPIWSGRVVSDVQSGARTYDFEAAEWAQFFEGIPAVPFTYKATNDHAIVQDVFTRAMAVPGQDPRIVVPATRGAAVSDLTINAWDNLTVDAVLRQQSAAEGGPEWYIGAGGTLENPTRPLVMGDRLGSPTPTAVLEYVEDSEVYVAPPGPPKLTLLGNLFPGQQPQAVVGRRGGNVIAHPARRQDGVATATVIIAIGAGEENAQLRATAESPLINAGYPRITRTTTYQDVTVPATLQRHADADLAAVAGLLTSYTLTTWDGEPDWTGIQRGDTVRVILDTDAYGAQRPVEFEARVLGIAVQVQDNGPAQINWELSTTMEH